LFLWLAGLVVVLAGGIFVLNQVSPWPSAMLVRYLFATDAARVSKALEKHVPKEVAAIVDQRYDETDADALLDVYFPSEFEGTARILPTVVWVHGGGWVSGGKDDVANYAKILAAKGFTVVAVNYSLAPGATYPTPVRQVNAALAYLTANAARLHVSANQFVLAGDSAGAHIAAQLANAISVPSYADAIGVVPSIDRLRLVGTILYCGAYDLQTIDMDGAFRGFLQTVGWSYTGVKNFRSDPKFETFSVVRHITPEFPPTFVSAGNADPLLPQSVAFADALEKAGVRVERLFFPEGHRPPLPHEYQFNLDNEAGRTALDHSVKFLSSVTQ
jgi:acetyl esterase